MTEAATIEVDLLSSAPIRTQRPEMQKKRKHKVWYVKSKLILGRREAVPNEVTQVSSIMLVVKSPAKETKRRKRSFA